MVLNQIVERLGKTFYQNDSLLLYNLYCMDGLTRLSDNSIDLTITSPPYNIGKAYEIEKPLPEYLDWCERWIREIYRITTSIGAFWLNLGYLSIPQKAKAIPIPYLFWDRVPFFLVQEVIWHYEAGVAGKKFLSPRNEKFLWYVKNESDYIFNLDAIRDPDVKYPNQRKNGKIKVNPLGKNPGDVWHFPKVTSGANRASKERTPHPAQFPAAVIERIILASSNEGDLILDPFMGSGTVAEVALRLKRRAIGFEINQMYCEISVRRVEQMLYQQQFEQNTLFG